MYITYWLDCNKCQPGRFGDWMGRFEVRFIWGNLVPGGKLPSALPSFLDSMQEDGMVEDHAERSEQGGASEELATFYSSQDQAMMQDCYSKIVEKLSVANPAMVLQVVGFKSSASFFFLWVDPWSVLYLLFLVWVAFCCKNISYKSRPEITYW